MKACNRYLVSESFCAR